MKEDNNIEDLFRSSFDHFEVAPPPAVKEAIDRKIGGSSKKGLWWISGLLLVLGTASFLFFFNYSSENQGKESSDNQLTSTETSSTNSDSKTTAHSGNSSSTHESSTSSTSQSGDKNALLQGKNTGSQKGSHSDGNQNLSSSGNNDKGNKSLTSNSGSKKTGSAKANNPKQKQASGKKSTGKKSSGKKNNSGTPGFNDLSAPLDLIVFDSNQQGNNNNNGINTPVDGNGKTGPKNPDETNNGVTSDTDPPKKTDSVVADPKENPITPQTADSTKKEEKKQPLPKPKNAGENWLASVYAGPLFVNNTKGNDEYRTLQEKPSFQFSAEINRSLFAGYGLTTGFGFNKRQENYKHTTIQVQDSAIVINDSIPIYGNPNVPDSITGYLDTTYYLDDTTSTDYIQLNRIQTIGIPLYFTKHFSFTDKWGLLVNAGAVFQFHKVSVGELNGMSAPAINKFSMNVTGRFHLTYTWNQWTFSAGVSTGWELKRAIIYQGLDRNRYFITPQLGFHFRF
ncbi:MAG: hypothetical protein V4604_07190 [Bacteroidota bacterium]